MIKGEGRGAGGWEVGVGVTEVSGESAKTGDLPHPTPPRMW